MNRDNRHKKNRGNNNWKKNDEQQYGRNHAEAHSNHNSHNSHPSHQPHNTRDQGKDHFKGNDRFNKYDKREPRVSHAVTPEQIRKDEEAIKIFKSNNHMTCSKCGQPITDITSAIAAKDNSSNIHFDCALQIIEEQEKLSAGEKIVYIGQGRFGVLYFENPHDMKHFTIRKTIDWEDRENKAQWRTDMAELYSHVR